MKRIIFIRHGRAEDSDPEISDLERSLTIRGKSVSRQMARRLKEKENNLGLFITSPAFRALETAFIFADEFSIKPENIRIDSDLYYKSGIKHLLELLKTIDENTASITMFGHNPAFTEMPDRLCTRGCEFLTKTSIVCISFPALRWEEVKVGTGRQEYFLKPEKQI